MAKQRMSTDEYVRYLKSPQWIQKRLRLIKKRGGKCECCSTTFRLQVHHLTYARIGNERDKDLQVLCVRCHEALHPHMRDGKPPRSPEQRRKERRPVGRDPTRFVMMTCSLCGESKRGTKFKQDQRKLPEEHRVCRVCQNKSKQHAALDREMDERIC